MVPVVTAEQMRSLEQETERAGVSMATLMERAGEEIARAALSIAQVRSRFLVVCGAGNNGGDGLVAARLLHRFGRQVQVSGVGDRSRGSPLASAQWARLSPEIPRVPFDPEAVRKGDVVIDALFGTGLNRAPAGATASVIDAIRIARSFGARVVSADLPSGLPTDHPHPFQPCVQADLTVALGAPKVSQVLEPGASRCGELRVVDIGLLAERRGALWLLDERSVKSSLEERGRDSHKGTYGHVLVIAGGPGKTGAAAMSGLGALRGGAGLVTVATRAEALPWIQLQAPELMGLALGGTGPLARGDLEALLEAAEGKDAVVIGPGIPRGPETGELIGELLARVDAPFVIDADALNAIAGRLEVLGGAKQGAILTPHPGEMARLCQRPTADVQADRLGSARELATTRKVTVVLKGARTVIAHPDGRIAINPTGNPGMATGGTGDVLSGLVGALLAQRLAVDPPTAVELAAELGVFAHGLAGDLIRERTGETGLVATDLLEGLCRVWRRWDR